MGNVGRHIPNNLRRFRKMHGYRQQQVVAYLGLKSTSRLSRWEKGVAMPCAKNLFKLSILYNTLSDQLYSDLVKDMKCVMSEKGKLPVSMHHKQHIKKK